MEQFRQRQRKKCSQYEVYIWKFTAKRSAALSKIRWICVNGFSRKWLNDTVRISLSAHSKPDNIRTIFKVDTDQSRDALVNRLLPLWSTLRRHSPQRMAKHHKCLTGAHSKNVNRRTHFYLDLDQETSISLAILTKSNAVNETRIVSSFSWAQRPRCAIYLCWHHCVRIRLCGRSNGLGLSSASY